MEYITSSGIKRYGVLFTVTHQRVDALEVYQYDGLTVQLPVGELLLGIVELSDILPIKSNSTAFANREYNLSEFFNSFTVSQEELYRFKRVKDFLYDIADNKKVFSYQMLNELFIRILPQNHRFFYLFKPRDRYRIRQIISKKNHLPFGCTTKQMIEELENTYSDFSFRTSTEINLLSEICALSLFELLESGYQIFRCGNCKRLFFAKKRQQYCTRPAPFNKHLGCEKKKRASYNKRYGQSESVRPYKRVYNRLLNRARRPNASYEDEQVFNDFKSGWALMKIKYGHSEEFEKKKKEFLTLESWE